MEGASTPRLQARSLRAAGVVCSILLLTNNRSAILAKTEAAEGPGWETPLRCKPELWRDAVVPESSSGRHCGAVWVCWGLPGHIHLVLGGCRAPCPSPPQTHSALQAFTTPSSSQPLPCAAPDRSAGHAPSSSRTLGPAAGSWGATFPTMFREGRAPSQDCSSSLQTLFFIIIIAVTLVIFGPVCLLPVYKKRESFALSLTVCTTS